MSHSVPAARATRLKVSNPLYTVRPTHHLPPTPLSQTPPARIQLNYHFLKRKGQLVWCVRPRARLNHSSTLSSLELFQATVTCERVRHRAVGPMRRLSIVHIQSRSMVVRERSPGPFPGFRNVAEIPVQLYALEYPGGKGVNNSRLIHVHVGMM